jgi:hypothetical protein
MQMTSGRFLAMAAKHVGSPQSMLSRVALDKEEGIVKGRVKLGGA